MASIARGERRLPRLGELEPILAEVDGLSVREANKVWQRFYKQLKQPTDHGQAARYARQTPQDADLGVDLHVADAATGAHIDVETALIIKHDPGPWATTMRAMSPVFRAMGFTVYKVWRLLGVKNPNNVRAGQQPKTLYMATRTRAQRQERARRAGLASMHGTTGGSEGEMASARGKHLAERRWRGKDKGSPVPWAKAKK